ncbi:hypothetical protein H6F43_02705 [Leptolyngbya sp. FACHB-36]|uniref:hypothetical protein n=1 Tax=Leptolyngbya sp. FACHB-36 TaxID=2692808 RepID=UPI00168107FB|nr:hypothetical protein [Leptolyngbya sp. FACHB-36]MBD2019095.1 hypothetical protein [Leptolyngbya sp. FACHB-36]
MTLTLRHSVGFILSAQVVALLLGYTLRAPDLQQAAEQTNAIRSERTQATHDRAIALQRAQICQPLMSELPISDGAAAYFTSRNRFGRIVIDKNRPFPIGSVVCDAFGNTAIVGRDAQGQRPLLTDIRTVPAEEMQQILVQRGVMPSPLAPHEVPLPARVPTPNRKPTQ